MNVGKNITFALAKIAIIVGLIWLLFVVLDNELMCKSDLHVQVMGMSIFLVALSIGQISARYAKFVQSQLQPLGIGGFISFAVYFELTQLDVDFVYGISCLKMKILMAVLPCMVAVVFSLTNMQVYEWYSPIISLLILAVNKRIFNHDEKYILVIFCIVVLRSVYGCFFNEPIPVVVEASESQTMPQEVLQASTRNFPDYKIEEEEKEIKDTHHEATEESKTPWSVQPSPKKEDAESLNPRENDATESVYSRKFSQNQDEMPDLHERGIAYNSPHTRRVSISADIRSISHHNLGETPK